MTNIPKFETFQGETYTNMMSRMVDHYNKHICNLSPSVETDRDDDQLRDFIKRLQQPIAILQNFWCEENKKDRRKTPFITEAITMTQVEILSEIIATSPSVETDRNDESPDNNQGRFVTKTKDQTVEPLYRAHDPFSVDAHTPSVETDLKPFTHLNMSFFKND